MGLEFNTHNRITYVYGDGRLVGKILENGVLRNGKGGKIGNKYTVVDTLKGTRIATGSYAYARNWFEERYG
jgi:hypothetical protein